MSECEICKKNEANIQATMFDGVTRVLCRDCHNQMAADFLGVQLSPFASGIYEYSGRTRKKHKFMIEKLVVPTGIGYEAVEVTKNNAPGFKVAVLDGFDCDQEYLFYKLEARIKSELSKRYLETGTFPDGRKYTGLKDGVVVGRFEYDEKYDGINKVVIDGQVFSWGELGRMLSAYEGFQFKLQIFDITDEIS